MVDDEKPFPCSSPGCSMVGELIILIVNMFNHDDFSKKEIRQWRSFEHPQEKTHVSFNWF